MYNSLQALFVITSSWSSMDGKLYLYERKHVSAPWDCISHPISVNVGKNGMTREKKEGDGKSPAGIFPIITAFGDASHRITHFPYLLIEEGLECVDDPTSKYYNQFVKDATDQDWNSSEKMWLIGNPYALGLVVGYNTDPIVPNQGSCIFIHILENPDKGTAGCTAMAESDLIYLISWLDPNKFPILVQLPQDEVNSKKLTQFGATRPSKDENFPLGVMLF